MTKLNYQELIEKLDQDIQKSNKNRYFIAISGPPASGKALPLRNYTLILH